jgi:hypothetical protein
MSKLEIDTKKNCYLLKNKFKNHWILDLNKPLKLLISEKSKKIFIKFKIINKLTKCNNKSSNSKKFNLKNGISLNQLNSRTFYLNFKQNNKHNSKLFVKKLKLVINFKRKLVLYNFKSIYFHNLDLCKNTITLLKNWILNIINRLLDFKNPSRTNPFYQLVFLKLHQLCQKLLLIKINDYDILC